MIADRLSSLSSSIEPALANAAATFRRRAVQRAANRPAPRAVRREWTRKLEEIGRFEIEDHLGSVAMLDVGPGDVVRFVDIGLTHGRHRFPTRKFVETWLGRDDAGEETREAEWRLRLALVAVIALIAGGIPALV